MKIAVLSDIHGNSVALDAVLRDISSQGGVDAYWVLGDLVALGPDPVGVLERLSKLPNGGSSEVTLTVMWRFVTDLLQRWKRQKRTQGSFLS